MLFYASGIRRAGRKCCCIFLFFRPCPDVPSKSSPRPQRHIFLCVRLIFAHRQSVFLCVDVFVIDTGLTLGVPTRRSSPLIYIAQQIGKSGILGLFFNILFYSGTDKFALFFIVYHSNTIALICHFVTPNHSVIFAGCSVCDDFFCSRCCCP